MKRVGEFIRELKKAEVSQGFGIAVAVIGLGSIGLLGVDKDPPQLSGRAVAAPPVTPKMNERGIPQESCSWTPHTHQQVKRLVGGAWSVKADGRCRDHADGVIRAYSAPYENEANKYPNVDGRLLAIADGQEIEVMCAKSGGMVVDNEGSQSDRWLYAEFNYAGTKVNAFLPAADAGFPPTFVPSQPPTGNVIPECPKF